MSEYNFEESGFEKDKKDWPAAIQLKSRPVDSLQPGSELHIRVRDYLREKLKASEREMRKFHARREVGGN